MVMPACPPTTGTLNTIETLTNPNQIKCHAQLNTNCGVKEKMQNHYSFSTSTNCGVKVKFI